LNSDRYTSYKLRAKIYTARVAGGIDFEVLYLILLSYLQIQQFSFKPATTKNIKPIVGLRPVTIFVAHLIGNCCKLMFAPNILANAQRKL
jgi:hypothetical protein